MSATLTSPSPEADAPDKDAARFESLYRAHYGSILAYSQRRFPERADDIVAETFLIAWRRLDFVPDDALPWLYGVARRVLSDSRRTTKRQGALAERLIGSVRLEHRSSPPLADSELAQALAALPECERELIRLVYWEDLEPARAAHAAGCSRAAAATRLWRARRRLRAELRRMRGEEE